MQASTHARRYAIAIRQRLNRSQPYSLTNFTQITPQFHLLTSPTSPLLVLDR